MSFFGLFSGAANKSVLGVDIGSSSLKVVQLRREGGKAVLETYGELALGPYGGSEIGQATNLSAEQIGESLKDLLREAKVTTKDAGMSIPFARSLLTLVELPRRKSAAEQKTVIELEARKYIPVPMTEVQLDWFIVPDMEPGVQDAAHQSKVEVVLVAVHNDELKMLQSISLAGALTTTFYEIEIFSTIRAVIDEPVKPVMVLDIGAASTKMYIVEHGVVALSHALSMGSQDITRAIAVSGNLTIARAEAVKKEDGLTKESDRSSLELVFTRIFTEAKRVLMQYETSSKKPITAIVLTANFRSLKLVVHCGFFGVKIAWRAIMQLMVDNT